MDSSQNKNLTRVRQRKGSYSSIIEPLRTPQTSSPQPVNNNNHDTSFSESVDSAEKGLVSQCFDDTTIPLNSSETNKNSEPVITSSAGSVSSTSGAYAALNGSKISSSTKPMSPCMARFCSCLLVILSLCLLIGTAFIGGFIFSKCKFFIFYSQQILLFFIFL